MVQRASSHANEDLVRADRRVGSVRVFQDLRSAVLMENNGFHEGPPGRINPKLRTHAL